MRDWMKKIGVVEKTTEDKEETKVDQEKVSKNEDGTVSSLVLYKIGNKNYISNVTFNPEEHETYEMQQKSVVSSFLIGQQGLNHFFQQYQNIKKKV